MTLTELKDKLALEHYQQPFWFLLSEHQQAMLVDHVAIGYALNELSALKNEVSINNIGRFYELGKVLN